jgi:hypothetical protein
LTRLITQGITAFRGRPLWATSAAGISWTTVAILNSVATIALIAIPYGFFGAPFTAIFALIAGYFAMGIWRRHRVLIALAAFLTALALVALWLVAGLLPLAFVALIPAASSLIAAWQIRKHDLVTAQVGGDPRSVMSRAGIARRVVISLLVVVVGAGGLWWGVSYGPLAGCRADGPHELPSGAPPGQGVEGMLGGVTHVVWGAAADQIDEVVGDSYFSADDPDQIRAASVSIHGHPAVLFALTPDNRVGQGLLAFSWSDGGCDRTVLLVRGMSIENAEAYAGRF